MLELLLEVACTGDEENEVEPPAGSPCPATLIKPRHYGRGCFIEIIQPHSVRRMQQIRKGSSLWQTAAFNRCFAAACAMISGSIMNILTCFGY